MVHTVFLPIDATGRLTDEHYRTPQGTPQATSLLQLAYTYDKAGNRLTKVYDNDDTNHKEEYTVNRYNQVTAVGGHRGKHINVTGLIDEDNLESLTVKRLTPTPEKEAVAVDIVNNFFIGRKVELAEGTNTLQAIATDKAGNTATYPATGSHTVILEEDVDEDYEYDLRGNMMLKKVDETVVARYFYIYDNLIEFIWYPEGVHDNEHPHYTYDGLNRRVKVEYGTVTVDQDGDFSSFGDIDTVKDYVFDGTQPIIEYDNDGGSRMVTRQYYWGTGLPGGIGGLLYLKVPGSPDAYYYYHYDGGGNVTCITDADKDIMALYEYDAFGNIITKCGSLANDFLFSTQMANSNAGWYMYMFRSYDPQLGRWTQRDPIGTRLKTQRETILSEPNLYEFCYNSPLNFIDLLGLFSRRDIWAACVGVIIGGCVGFFFTGDAYVAICAGAVGGALAVEIVNADLCDKNTGNSGSSDNMDIVRSLLGGEDDGGGTPPMKVFGGSRGVGVDTIFLH